MKEVATTETVAEFQGINLPIPTFARAPDNTVEQLQRDGWTAPILPDSDRSQLRENIVH